MFMGWWAQGRPLLRGRGSTFWWPVRLRPANTELMEIRVHKRQLIWVDVSRKVAKLSWVALLGHARGHGLITTSAERLFISSQNCSR